MDDYFFIKKSVYVYAGHHPDLHLVGWNNVKIDIWTHSVSKNIVISTILAPYIFQLSIYKLKLMLSPYLVIYIF